MAAARGHRHGMGDRGRCEVRSEGQLIDGRCGDHSGGLVSRGEAGGHRGKTKMVTQWEASDQWKEGVYLTTRRKERRSEIVGGLAKEGRQKRNCVTHVF